MQASKGLVMEKRLCWASLGVAGVFLLVLLADLVTKGMILGIASISPVVEIMAIICCGVVGYLAWDALQDLQ